MSIMHGIEYVGYVDPWTDEERLSDEEIVRCRDCRNFKKADSGSFCAKSITALTDPDGFCAWGERRDG